MGTLTAGQPRLPGYCDHKLPTSCRLSSIPECCACADERIHAPQYSVYIDGVGYVLRGSRWQRYCWFCKEFWANRVRASGLTPSQTRIPNRPDQTAFVARWYEFHQGYRLVRREDGSEERVAVIGEDFRDVSPGIMPRTIEELRDGRSRSAFEENETQAHIITTPVDNGPSLDSALDALMEEVVAEEQTQRRSIVTNIHAQAITSAGSRITRTQEYQVRRITALRRELHRMRNGIERVVLGLRELGESVPDTVDATDRLARLDSALGAMSDRGMSQEARLAIQSVNELTQAIDDTNSDGHAATLQERITQAQTQVYDARTHRRQAEEELATSVVAFEAAQRNLRNLQAEQRTTENMVRIFGTREEVNAQGEAYESPIGGMFNRAWERFREAESTRQEERTLRQYLESEEAVGGEALMSRLTEIEAMGRDVWGVPQSQSTNSESLPSQGIRHADTSNTTQLMEMARDEVFAGQGSESQAHIREALQGEREPLAVTLTRHLAGESGEPVDIGFRGQTSRTGAVRSTDNPTSSDSSSASYSTDAAGPSPNSEPPSDDYLDLQFILTALCQQDERSGSDPDALRRNELQDLTASEVSESLSNLPELDLQHFQTLRLLLHNVELCWSVGLPRFRLLRKFRRGIIPHFSENQAINGVETEQEDLELMATAFQASGRVREASPILVGRQHFVLSMIEHGRRPPEIRRMLSTMLDDPSIKAVAQQALQERFHPEQPHLLRQIESLETQRAELVGQTESSRDSLARRRRDELRAVVGASMQMDMPRFRRAPSRSVEASAAIMADLDREIRAESRAAAVAEEDQEVGLDARDSGRPEAKTEEELTIKSGCQICFDQVADVACLPCGHLVMCRWCSEQHSPCHVQDRTRPRRPASCPICRKNIKQKVRIYRA